jgi:hypothetical protein
LSDGARRAVEGPAQAHARPPTVAIARRLVAGGADHARARWGVLALAA